MRIVVDTNIVFSALLNTNGKLARILLQPKSGVTFYTTNYLYEELKKHKKKLLELSGYSEQEYTRALEILTKKIKIINYKLISKECFKIAYDLTHDIDEDDTEFIALTEHIKGKLWSSDITLTKGLMKKSWNKIILTNELYKAVIKK